MISSNIDSLNALLSIQESLRLAVSGTKSLSRVLPDLLFSILESIGSRDGRLDLVNLQPDGIIAIIVKAGRAETVTRNAVPNSLKQAISRCVSQTGQHAYIEDSQQAEDWFAAAHPEYTSSPWSALIVPILTGETAVGCLTVLKPGRRSFESLEIVISSLYAGQLGAALSNIRLQEETRSAESRLRDALQDNHDLAAILVHDLQGPLGNIVTSLEMLEAGLTQQEDAGVEFMMDTAMRSSRQLQSLVNSLMDISRLEAGQDITDREPLALSELVDYAAEVVEPILGQRQVTLVRELDTHLPTVDGNADILHRVLLNLLDNALKVSRQSQKITIRAFINPVGDNHFVQIQVVDEGPGIAQEDRERIFKKYERVNNQSASKGLGLGLAFCKLAVEAHGGLIWVGGTEDGGACFCFTLPIADKTDLDA